VARPVKDERGPGSVVAVPACLALALVLAGCGAHHGSSSGGATGSSRPGRPVATSLSAGSTPRPAPGTASPSRSSSAGLEAGAPPAVDKCTVVTAAEVGAAFGLTVAQEDATTSGIGLPLCLFTLAGPRSGPLGRLSATLTPKFAAAAFAAARRNATGAEDVAGLASGAYYLPAAGTLKVLAGTTLLTLQYNPYQAGAEQPSRARLGSVLTVLARSYLSQN
jgi:hypothetical protein